MSDAWGPWTRARFLRELGHERDDLRLFPIQSALFYFLEAEEASANPRPWLAFSLELVSEHAALALCTAATPEKQPRPSPTHEAGVMSPSAALDYSVGRRSLVTPPVSPAKNERAPDSPPPRPVGVGIPERGPSQQSRFFAAMTPRGLSLYLSRVPLREQHLYEIIRADQPCRLYLDLEREVDTCCLDDATVAEAVLEGCGRDAYHAAFLHALRGNTTVCPVGCPYRTPLRDAATVTSVLLLFINRFFADCRPELGLHEALPVAFPDTLTAPESQVLVMVSANMDHTPAKKFSLHVILRAVDGVESSHCRREVQWASNGDVGLAVQELVAYLYESVAALQARRLRGTLSAEAACELEALHSALFFHTDGTRDVHGSFLRLPRPAPEAAPSTSEEPSTATVSAPVMALRCIIDPAVYSKNRMFRCLGSCKIGKTATLVPYRATWPEGPVWPESAELTDLVLASLIGLYPAVRSARLATRVKGLSTAASWAAEDAIWQGGLGQDAAVFSQDAHEPNQGFVPPVDDPPGRQVRLIEQGLSLAESTAGRKRGPRRDAPRRCGSISDALAADNAVSRRGPTSCEALNAFALLVAGPPTGAGSGQASVYKHMLLADPETGAVETVLLVMQGGRYCRNVSRCHRSNNIYLIFHLVRESVDEDSPPPPARSEPSPMRVATPLISAKGPARTLLSNVPASDTAASPHRPVQSVRLSGGSPRLVQNGPRHRRVLTGMSCTQKCFDPDCNTAPDGTCRSFRSAPIPVPNSVITAVAAWLPMSVLPALKGASQDKPV